MTLNEKIYKHKPNLRFFRRFLKCEYGEHVISIDYRITVTSVKLAWINFFFNVQTLDPIIFLISVAK